MQSTTGTENVRRRAHPSLPSCIHKRFHSEMRRQCSNSRVNTELLDSSQVLSPEPESARPLHGTPVQLFGSGALKLERLLSPVLTVTKQARTERNRSRLYWKKIKDGLPNRDDENKVAEPRKVLDDVNEKKIETRML